MAGKVSNTTEQFQIAASLHGCRLDRVNGRMHYVSVNTEGIAMVGPQAQRRKGWRWPYKKSRSAVRCSTYLNAGADSPELVRIMHSEANSMLKELAVENIEMPWPPTPPPPAPQPAPSRWAVFKDKWTSRFYDQEWHRGVRNVCGNIIMFAVTAITLVAAIKGILWLVLP